MGQSEPVGDAAETAADVVVDDPAMMLDAVAVTTPVLPLPRTVDDVEVDCVPPADG